jgi:regulator of sigma E protease
MRFVLLMLLTFATFFLILSVLVLIHEFGHFIVAKRLGIKVEEFGFGLPPRLWGFRYGETLYSINWLPIGGFVRLFGEEEEIKKRKGKKVSHLEQRAFYARPFWQKTAVVAAGVTMNFLLAVAIISFLFTQGVMIPTKRVHVEKVMPGTPAAMIGLAPGDIIQKVTVESTNESIDLISGEQLISTSRQHLGETLVLTVLRNTVVQDFSLVPRKEYPKTEGPMGIVISNFEEKRYSIVEAPIVGLKESLFRSYELGKGIVLTVGKLIMFQPVAKDVAGPIGIAVMTGDAVRMGRLAVLEWLSLLSLNLAIVNILPFPALDGGRLVFIVIERVTGKKIRTNIEHVIHQVGFLFLLFLVVIISINDLLRYIGK